MCYLNSIGSDFVTDGKLRKFIKLPNSIKHLFFPRSLCMFPNRLGAWETLFWTVNCFKRVYCVVTSISIACNTRTVNSKSLMWLKFGEFGEFTKLCSPKA